MRARGTPVTDLNDSTATRLGWHIYWTNAGAFVFTESSGRSGTRADAQHYNPISSTEYDYEFLTRANVLNGERLGLEF